MLPIITLTTDFGLIDGYVATMKGVILSICPSATLVDISHGVPPHDVMHGAFVLGTSHRYFPAGTINLAVVDPGVGSARNPILLVTPHGKYIAPDNGLLTHVLIENGLQITASHQQAHRKAAFMEPLDVSLPQNCQAFQLNRPEYWLEPVSDTFHGRDIFAPVAAYLASGVPADRLGSPLSHIKCSNVPVPTTSHSLISGNVMHIDHFGNLISNIRMEYRQGMAIEVMIEGKSIKGPSRSYVSAKGLLAIIGSHGYLEVAYNGGSAAELLGAEVGTALSVSIIE